MSFKYLLCFGAAMLMMALEAVAANTDNIAAEADHTAAHDITAAEPSLYSAAYLSPKSVVVGPYEQQGAVASSSTNIIRTTGNFGQVQKADVLPYQLAGPYASPIVPGPYAAPVIPGPYPYSTTGSYPYSPVGSYPYATNGPYPYAAAEPYPLNVAAGPYPYGALAPVKAYGYGPSIASQAYNGYGPAVAPPYVYNPVGAPVVTPPAHSVSHASFSGPYRAPYSYKR